MKYCVRCGEPIEDHYKFCRRCFLQLLDKGEIEQCDRCGNWHYSFEYCPCRGKNSGDEFEDDIKCIICDNPSNGMHFCKDCYRKYKDKTVAIHLSEDHIYSVEDIYYGGRYIAKDGHVVKSKAELEIDNYLYDHNIKHVYEKEILLEGMYLHPDFYLPEEDIYIEHWGYGPENEDYTQKKLHKMELYSRAKLRMIYTNKEDVNNLSSILEEKIKEYYPFTKQSNDQKNKSSKEQTKENPSVIKETESEEHEWWEAFFEKRFWIIAGIVFFLILILLAFSK